MPCASNCSASLDKTRLVMSRPPHSSNVKVAPSSNEDSEKKVEKTEQCKNLVITLYETIAYLVVKLIPCVGKRIPFLRRCKDENDPTSDDSGNSKFTIFCKGMHMHTAVKRANVGVPVTYEDFTNLMNTFLLISALFLSFVAATGTMLDSEQLINMDLLYCKRGWALAEACIDLDRGGRFGEFNATGLISNSTIKSNDFSVNDDLPMDVSNISGFLLFGNSVQYTGAQDIPSFSIMFYTAVSTGMLCLAIFCCFLQYLLLVLTGARTLGDEVMDTYWQTGVILVIFEFVCIIASVLFWMQSLCRIIGGLNPPYKMHGDDFWYYTSNDAVGDYTMYFSAYANERIFLNGALLIVFPCALISIVFTFRVEKNLVFGRPKTISEFIEQALDALDDNDFLETNDGLSGKLKKQVAITRVKKIFKSVGFAVNVDWVSGDLDELCEAVKRKKRKMEGSKKEIAEQEFKDLTCFIEEFKHLDWNKLCSSKMKRTQILSMREKARLFVWHEKLYGKQND